MRIINYLNEIKSNELFRGSLILLILFNVGNVFSYLFQMSMARMLGPADYGVLAVITSIIYIFSVPTNSIQTIICKKTTRFMVNKEYGKIKGFLEDVLKKILIIALIIFIIFSVFSIYLSNLFAIPYWLLLLTGLFIFGAFISPIAGGLLQGTKNFTVWGWNNIASTLLKLIVAIILVYLGFAVYGAVIGFIIGTLFSFFFVFPFVKKITTAQKVGEKFNIFSKDIISTFFAILFIVAIYSTDVIFVKIFFSSEIAGKYAVISMIGKIILFGVSGIGNAMFPISSEKFNEGNGTRGVIKKAFLAAFLWCAGLVGFFFLFPEFTISILFGSTYLTLKNALVYIGIAFSLISFLNLFILYKISTDKFRLWHNLVLLTFLAIQLIFFYLFNRDIVMFSLGFMFSTIITFIGSIILIRK